MGRPPLCLVTGVELVSWLMVQDRAGTSLSWGESLDTKGGHVTPAPLLEGGTELGLPYAAPPQQVAGNLSSDRMRVVLSSG